MKSFNEGYAHSLETLEALGRFLLFPVSSWTEQQMLYYLFSLRPDQMAADVTSIPVETDEQFMAELLGVMVRSANEAPAATPNELAKDFSDATSTT